MKARPKSISVSGRAQAPSKNFGAQFGVHYKKSRIFRPARLGLRSPSSNAINVIDTIQSVQPVNEDTNSIHNGSVDVAGPQ